MNSTQHKIENSQEYKNIRNFYNLLRIRMIEEAIAEKYKEQEMRCPVHLSIGQEAVAVAACAHLTKDDYATSTHRAHAHYLAKGGNLTAMIAEFYGKSTGCSSGRGGSMHLIDQSVGFLGCVPIVGSTISIGVGAAFGAKLQGNNNITIIFLGEGATEEGVFYECLNFVLLHRLSVIFVCENNLYSIVTPFAKRRPQSASLTKITEGFNMESYQLDGQDCPSLMDSFEKIVSQVRKEQAPAFVECATYRYLESCGPNAEINLRPVDEIESWRERDPVKIFSEYFLEKAILGSKDIENFRSNISTEITQAFNQASLDSFPKMEDLTKHIFREKL
jgi:pyruvate dehydrogenase E1 component alpha subunit